MSSSTCSIQADMPPRSARRVLGGSLVSLTSFCCCCLLLERAVADVDAFARFVAVAAVDVDGPATAFVVLDVLAAAFGSEALVLRFSVAEVIGEAGSSGAATADAGAGEPAREPSFAPLFAITASADAPSSG